MTGIQDSHPRASPRHNLHVIQQPLSTPYLRSCWLARSNRALAFDPVFVHPPPHRLPNPLLFILPVAMLLKTPWAIVAIVAYLAVNVCSQV